MAAKDSEWATKLVFPAGPSAFASLYMTMSAAAVATWIDFDCDHDSDACVCTRSEVDKWQPKGGSERAQRESRMPGGLATDCIKAGCIKADCTHKVFGNRIKCRTGKHSTPTQQLTKPHDMPSLECMDCGGICSGGGWSWTAAHQGEVPCCCTVDDPSRIFAVVETQARTSLHLHLFDYFPVFECKNCHIAVSASAGMFTTSQGGGGHCAACSSSDGPCGSDDLDLFN